MGSVDAAAVSRRLPDGCRLGETRRLPSSGCWLHLLRTRYARDVRRRDVRPYRDLVPWQESSQAST